MGTGNGSTAIEANEVSKVYKGTFTREVQALDRLSLSIPSGEIFGLLGPNGAGKTTLVKILLDICRPTSGSTSIFGRSSRHPGARDRVGYLPEDHQFPPYLTGMGALELYGALSGLPKSTCRELGMQALERVNMSEWADVKTRKYSKGMKQRLGIAQAIFHDPDLILLDEPTDGVDPVGRKAIRDLLLELHGRGKTIFVNSHLLLEVELICQRVVILHKGKVLETGSVEDLTGSSDEYRVKAGGDSVTALKIVEETAGSAKEAPDGIHFHAPDEGSLDKVVSALAAAGCPVREVVAVKKTLEDIFIDRVEESEAGASREGGQR
ncbi:MAG: ABC transporter ATP-binding protein [Planctomycetota bacterium]|jgi:ABC-2 type transport system ATP-binding protein